MAEVRGGRAQSVGTGPRPRFPRENSLLLPLLSGPSTLGANAPLASQLSPDAAELSARAQPARLGALAVEY